MPLDPYWPSGLKVRMGIATGVLSGAGVIPAGSAVHEAAKRESVRGSG